MGVYDCVMLHCPRCGKKYNAQSKGGECVLAQYTLETAPPDVMSNVNRHAPFECDRCGTYFEVETVYKEVASIVGDSDHEHDDRIL